MYPENPEGTQVIVGSMNMGYISDTARNRTHNLFHPRRVPIPLGHSDGQFCALLARSMLHTGTCANVALITYYPFGPSTYIMFTMWHSVSLFNDEHISDFYATMSVTLVTAWMKSVPSVLVVQCSRGSKRVVGAELLTLLFI